MKNRFIAIGNWHFLVRNLHFSHFHHELSRQTEVVRKREFLYPHPASVMGQSLIAGAILIGTTASLDGCYIFLIQKKEFSIWIEYLSEHL